jgi:hypothetical protein
MDPKDLLITNQFLSPNINVLSPNINEFNDYADLKRFLENTMEENDENEESGESGESEESEESDYDDLEKKSELTSILNRSQWLPQNDFQNHSLSQGVIPIFSKSLNDTNKVRYRKKIISYINIDSQKRDVKNYPNPAQYRIFLNKEFHNLYSIRLENMIFREPPTPIHSGNNCFTWITNYTGLENVIFNTEVQYQATIPGAFYTLGEFSQVIEETLNAVQHNLPSSTFPSGWFPMFRFTIDPFSRSVRFIQRLEEFIVTSLETTVNSNEIKITVSNQSGVAPPGPPDFPFRPSVEDIPLLLAGLDLFATNFGGIPVLLFDQVPFYPAPVMGMNQYEIVSGDANNYIYRLTVFTEEGETAVANQSRTYDLTSSNLRNISAGHAVEVTVGRAVSFTIPENCNPFGSYLGLQNSDENLLIHTNYNEEKKQVMNKIPWMILGAGQLALDTMDYILMRIETRAKPIGTISGNLTCAIGAAYENKKNNVFFAKIIFAGSSPGDVVVHAVGGDKFFYDAPFVQLVELDIAFFDSFGNVLSLTQDHSFVLQMVELREVLKDTLLDSRTGTVSDTGSGISTTNPLD